MSNECGAEAGKSPQTADTLGRFFPLEAMTNPPHCSPRVLAHLGDGVYELLVREWVLYRHPQATVKVVHAESSRLACATFQVTLLNVLSPDLSESEQALLKRCRNVPVSMGRKNQQALHRLSTSLEALVGYWYLEHPERLSLLKSALWRLAHLESSAYESLSASFRDKSAREATPLSSPKAKRIFF